MAKCCKFVKLESAAVKVRLKNKLSAVCFCGVFVCMLVKGREREQAQELHENPVRETAAQSVRLHCHPENI